LPHLLSFLTVVHDGIYSDSHNVSQIELYGRCATDDKQTSGEQVDLIVDNGSKKL
jgi:hypothetical protein